MPTTRPHDWFELDSVEGGLLRRGGGGEAGEVSGAGLVASASTIGAVSAARDVDSDALVAVGVGGVSDERAPFSSVSTGDADGCEVAPFSVGVGAVVFA
ncbi:MAG: hypothetical protein AAFN13_10055, partial [Bacteroidota bacterium]